MPKITLSRAHPPRLLLGWERRVYPDDVVLRRRLCDPRVLAAWDALVQHPRVVSDYYGPIDYWRDRRLARVLLRHPDLLALVHDPAQFAVAVAHRFGFLRFRGAYRSGLCCVCGWKIRETLHQKYCPRETKARRRYKRLRALTSFDAAAHPRLPGVHRAVLTTFRAGPWGPRQKVETSPVMYYFAREGLSEFYALLRHIVGPFQADRFWKGLHLKRRLLPHLPGPQGVRARRALLRTLAPEVFRRLAVAPIRGQ